MTAANLIYRVLWERSKISKLESTTTQFFLEFYFEIVKSNAKYLRIISKTFVTITHCGRKTIVHKGVPVPFFKTPIPWPSLHPPVKICFPTPLPSFLFHPLLRYFRQFQFPPPSHNPLLPWSFTFLTHN